MNYYRLLYYDKVVSDRRRRPYFNNLTPFSNSETDLNVTFLITGKLPEIDRPDEKHYCVRMFVGIHFHSQGGRPE